MATVKKKQADPQQGIIINKIEIRPVVRTTQDIEKWRSALQAAEAMNPIRVPLYDLYADLLLDGMLKSLMGKRIGAVTKTRLVFLDENDKENKDIKKLIKSKMFRKLRKEMMLRKFWGISVIELSKVNNALHIYSVPRKHIKPKEGRIVYEQYGNDGYDYREPPANKYILEAGETDDLGLMLEAAQYVIYKRGGFGDWSHFAEIFGMPFREARYDGFNQEVRAQLEMALEQAGSAAYAILPKEAEITFHEAKNTQGSSQLFNDLRKACNEELSILILGQTETTTSSVSSGYAQSKTHAEVEEGINADDREDELGILNEDVLPILANLGYPVLGGRFEHVMPGEKIPAKDLATIVDTLRNKVKLPLDDDELYQKFGFGKPKDYDAQKKKAEDAANAAIKAQNAPPQTDGKGGNKPPATGKKKALKLTAKLNELYKGCCDHTPVIARNEAIPSKLSASLEDEAARLVRKIYRLKGMPDTIDKKMAKSFAAEFSKAVVEGFGQGFDEVDYTTPDGEMLASLQKNIYQFSAAKNWQQLKDLSAALVDENSRLRSFADFKAAALEINNNQVNTWLKAEYNTAVASAQMAASWVRIQADKATLPMLEFDAVMDARTSAICRPLNGVVKPVNDPFWNTWYPPNHFGCRSDVRQHPSGRTATPDSDFSTPDIHPMFKTNLAKSGLAFPPKHPYWIDCPDDIKKAGEALIN